jgi:general secretion pathway protein F
VLRQKLANALVYPIILTLLALFIVSGLLVYVVPKVVGVFENTGAELPLLTQILIGTSDFLRANGIYVLILIAAATFVARRALRSEGTRRRWHGFLLRVPLVGRLTRGVNTARFTRTFSILAGSGVPVLESLRIAGAVVTNLPMRDAVSEAALRVREGAPIGKSLAASKVFPPMTIHLVSSGEASGQLETMLGRAATNQEREMDGLIAALLAIMEPALIITMGVVVLIIVIAILLPIFELNELVR